jgi:NTE family protein
MKWIARLMGKDDRPKVGLALGGGAVLGAAHVGVLRALAELEIKVDMVSGTSIGAVVAALYAFTQDWTVVRDVFRGLDWLNVSRLAISKYGLLSNQGLQDLVQKAIGDKNFADAPIPLAVVAADITTGQRVILDHGNVAAAVMASAAIPGLYAPVEIDGRALVDGGILENLPVSHLKNMGAGSIIAVELVSLPAAPQNLVDVLVNALHFAVARSTELQGQEADTLVALDLAAFNRTDTRQIDDLIDAGHRQALEILGTTSK